MTCATAGGTWVATEAAWTTTAVAGAPKKVGRASTRVDKMKVEERTGRTVRWKSVGERGTTWGAMRTGGNENRYDEGV